MLGIGMTGARISGKFIREADGASAVEFAMVVLPMVIIFLVIIQFGLIKVKRGAIRVGQLYITKGVNNPGNFIVNHLVGLKHIPGV